MRSVFFATLSIVACLATSGVYAQKQFRLFASIVDSTGSPAATVGPDDIRVTENGTEAKILKVEPLNWPLKVQLLLDNGIGLGSQNINQLRNGLKGLLDKLPDGTELTLVTTAPQPRQVVK